jgi:hypothetical protein
MHRFGQHPAIERRRLIKGTRLLLQQRQIMQRVGDEVLTLITARVHRDLLPAADDGNPVDIAFDHNLWWA